MCTFVPAAANPSSTLGWGTGPRPEKRQNSLSSSPLSAAHPDTANPSSCTRSDTSHSGDVQHPISVRFLSTFCHLRSLLIYCILCPQYFRGATKPVLILKLPVCISAALPPSCSLLYRVHCCVHCCVHLCAQNVHNVQFRDSRCLTMQPVTFMHTFIFTSLFAAYTMSSLSLSA